MSFITSIGIANPPYRVTQPDISEFMIRAMRLGDEDARKLRALYRMTGIESRYSVIGDYGKDGGYEFYANSPDGDPFPTTKKRMELFRFNALKLSMDAVAKCLSLHPEHDRKSFTHIIVVSCTGLYAPGLDIELVKALGLSSEIQRLCINFMGCYAAFNALKIADNFCNQQPGAKVLVVCTELCSIHFQRENNQDNLLANALFGDGSAALIVEHKPRKGINLRPASFFCDLATEGEGDMAWTVGDSGFEMRLSAYVPDIIRKGIGNLTNSLLKRISASPSDVAYYAIHPGGKKILEVIEQELGITREQNCHAYDVLKRFGNMSSPTVVFVLHEIAKTFGPTDEGKSVLSFAFGPGLTLESMLLKIEYH